jgi:hypothetical protein
LLTIYIDTRPHPIINADGSQMTVCGLYIFEGEEFHHIRGLKSFSNINGVKLIIRNRPFYKKLQLPDDLNAAISSFLQTKHAKQDIKFDCRAFANSVKGVEQHEIAHLLQFWDLKPKPHKLKTGDVIFFTSGTNSFHHAAIYIGSGLYISVYGAGGDLEVATLKDMKRDFKAEHVLLATPKI